MIRLRMDESVEVYPVFRGSDLQPDDDSRLKNQMLRVRDVMRCGDWMTVEMVCQKTGDRNYASVQRQMRYLREEKNGGYLLDKRLDENVKGLWWFRLRPAPKGRQERLL